MQTLSLTPHLELTQGILETCYTRDPDRGSLIPNPTLPMLSDLASFCEDKMQSLEDFLAEFVDNEGRKMYAEYIASKSERIKSEPIANKLEP